MKTVVIIDDHEVLRAGLTARLEGRWNITGEASSLEEAKALFASAEKAPDLIILDIELGKDWGLDILRDKTLPPVLVYSVYDDFAHVNAAMRAGAKGYVCKSQGMTELLEAMETAASGKTAFNLSQIQRHAEVSDLMLALTKREREIFNMVQRGLDNKQIAAALGVSLRTIENNLSLIYDKTGVSCRRELEKL